MLAQLLEDPLGAALGRRRGQELQGPLQGHLQHVVRRLQADELAIVDDEGAIAPHTGPHLLARLRVDAQGAGQAEQLQSQLQVHAGRIHPFQQADPLGLLGLLSVLAGLTVLPQLDVGAVGAVLQVDGQPALWIGAQKLGPVLLATEQLLHLFRGQIRGGELGWQAGCDPLPVLLFGQEGTELADTDLRRQLLQLDPAHFPGIDAGLLLLHLFGQAALPQVELAQIGQPVRLSGSDVIQGLFHLRGEVQVHQFIEVFLQQIRHREGHEGGHQFLALLEGVAPLQDGVDDGGVGAGPPDALGLQRLDQGGLGVPGRRLGLVADGLQLSALHLLVHSQGRQGRLLALQRGFRIV